MHPGGCVGEMSISHPKQPDQPCNLNYSRDRNGASDLLLLPLLLLFLVSHIQRLQQTSPAPPPPPYRPCPCTPMLTDCPKLCA